MPKIYSLRAFGQDPLIVTNGFHDLFTFEVIRRPVLVSDACNEDASRSIVRIYRLKPTDQNRAMLAELRKQPWLQQRCAARSAKRLSGAASKRRGPNSCGRSIDYVRELTRVSSIAPTEHLLLVANAVSRRRIHAPLAALVVRTLLRWDTCGRHYRVGSSEEVEDGTKPSLQL